jgi:hypothetical protein
MVDDSPPHRNRIVVKLSDHGTCLIARSEARRILGDLGKVREVILDFEKVQEVGQGFADEAFRVWLAAHAGTVIIPVKMRKAVAFMIERARRRSA